jgi:VWFA-related protein
MLPILVLSSVSFLAKDEKTRQQKTEEGKPAEKAPFTFRVPVDVVVVNATATDKKGNPVTDLTVNDFKVYEDGRPQPIHTFALEAYQATQVLDATGKKVPAEGTAPGAPNFTQPRFLSAVIDDITAASNEQYYRVTEALRKFVENGLGPGDQVAILAASGRVEYPFTNDKGVLLEQIGMLYKKLNVNPSSRSQCPQLTDLQAQRIFNRVSDFQSLEVAIQETISCANLNPNDPGTGMIAENMARSAASQQFQETQYRNRTLLYALRQHIRSLKHFEARKSIILISDGFLFQELTFELQEVVDAALRAGVVLNTMDLRGLYTTSPQASDNFANVPPHLLGAKESLLMEDARAEEDPLFTLADDTGGTFFHNNNDFYMGLQKISTHQAFYYVLTYATPSSKADGRYHKIKLEVSRPDLELTYRKGYYAPKEQLTFERRKKEDILEALQAPGNLNEIPINFSYNYFQLDDSRFEVALVTNVSVRGMQFLQEESRHKNLLNLVVVALDENDRYVDGLEKSVDFNLTDPSYAALQNYGFSSKVDLRLPPGRYKVKAVVRESVQSKMGSITKAIEIP